MSVRLFKIGAGNSCSVFCKVCVGFAQLDLYSVVILNSGTLDQSKFGRLHQSGLLVNNKELQLGVLQGWIMAKKV